MTFGDLNSMIQEVQAHSDALAAEDCDETVAVRPLHATTTVAVRLLRSDADAVSTLAAEQGMSVSTLLRRWILAGLRAEQGDDVDGALLQLEEGIGRLRRVLG